MRTYAQSGQYHLTWYPSYALNLVMSIEPLNVEQRTPKDKGVESPRRHSKKMTKTKKKKGVEPRLKGGVG